MPLSITPQAAPCGAFVHGIDLRRPLTPETAADLRRAWLAHQVLAFPDQALSLEDLERIARTLLWDNRCVVHAATGGYDGHARLLHRITVTERLVAPPARP